LSIYEHTYHTKIGQKDKVATKSLGH